MSKALASKAGLVVALAAAASALSGVPAASAGAPPGGPGGCNMLDAPLYPGLIQMMAGSQNSSQDGIGQKNMFQMLAQFPCP
jgi:hypothetical protein